MDECPFTVETFLQDRNQTLDSEFAKVTPMPGAERLVRHLASNGVPICVATGSKTRNYNIKSAANPSLFEPFAGRVICGDDPRLTRGKPTPDVFLLAAREGLQDETWKDRVREPGPEFDGTLKGGEGEFLVFEDAKVISCAADFCRIDSQLTAFDFSRNSPVFKQPLLPG